MTSLDAMEAFAEVVINLAWAALIVVSALIVFAALRTVVTSVLRARITMRSSTRKP